MAYKSWSDLYIIYEYSPRSSIIIKKSSKSSQRATTQIPPVWTWWIPYHTIPYSWFLPIDHIQEKSLTKSIKLIIYVLIFVSSSSSSLCHIHKLTIYSSISLINSDQLFIEALFTFVSLTHTLMRSRQAKKILGIFSLESAKRLYKELYMLFDWS